MEVYTCEMTKKQKLENFWFYHKWHVLAAVFVIFAVTVCVTQCAAEESADYIVGLTLNRIMSQKETDILAEALEVYGEDINGDGKVTVKIYDYSYKESQNDQIKQTNREKFRSELTSGNCMLFITDEYRKSYFDEYDMAQKFDFAESGYLKLDGGVGLCEALEEAGFENPEELYLLVRKVEGTAAEKTNSEAKINLEAAQKLLSEIAAN